MAEKTEQTDILDHVAIEIRSYDSLVIPIKEKMETISTASCIRRINRNLLEKNKDQFIPQKISIGLFHHDKNDLKPMEDHKWRYLYSLLNRKPHLEVTLDNCVKTLRELEHKARLCYEGHEQIKISSNEFVELMLVDAGFLIELFLRHSIKGMKRRGDHVFNTSGLLYELRCDMLMLENQIPYFILQRLFEIVPVPQNCKLSLTELAFRFFRDMIPGDHKLHLAKFGQEGNHLLDLIRHCFLPTIPRVKANQGGDIRGLPYKATKLRAAGIKLKKASTQDLLDIKFVNGVLEIPPIKVHQYTERLFSNLIAFEQCGTENVPHISSYVLLMKSLLEDQRDVRLLKQKEILTNYDVPKKEEVFTLFQRLWKEMNVAENVKEFYYDGLCEQVKQYKRSSWRLQNWNLGKPLKHIYLQKPLPRFVIVIAVLLILLILVGALFSIVSYFRHEF